MNHDEIQWEQCSLPTHKEHGRYRGFDLHQWNYQKPLLCFYPSEGEATESELNDLRFRILRLELDWWQEGYVTDHTSRLGGSACSLKVRFDDRHMNYCLEIRAPTLEEQLAKLDTIIDALWQDSGLRQSLEPMPVGRWR